MARLPPFDVPASEEVDAYRRASLGAFFDLCVSSKGSAEFKRKFVRANSMLLDRMPVYPGVTFATSYTIDQRDGSGCPEGLGAPTSYWTYRTYRLPADAAPRQVIGFYGRSLAGWQRAFASTPTQCEQTFTRGDQLLAVRACGEGLTLTARAQAQREPGPAPRLPPRPYGAQYPIAETYGDTPEPKSYEVEPGDTCERISGADAPSIIIPPNPGIRAEFRDEPLQQQGAAGFPRHVVVEWRFDKILGDCPPTELHLTLPNPTRGMPPLSLPFDVRARSGTARLPILDSFRDAYILWATAESLDGARSRTVSVFIRRPR